MIILEIIGKKMTKQYISAIDIGTSKITALIGEIKEDQIQLIGLGEAPSTGLDAGLIINIDQTTEAIQTALSNAERIADCKILSISTGISGNHIRCLNAHGEVNIRDGEVSQSDVDRSKEIALAISLLPENQILHTVVQEYSIDGVDCIRHPIGINGARLDTKIHIITGQSNAERNIRRCVDPCHLDINEIKVQALASADAILTEDEKKLGVCVLDIGCGTTDIAVYFNDAIRHTAVLPLGGHQITRDIHRALITTYQAAEDIKIRYGSVLPEAVPHDNMIEVPSLGEQAPRQIAHFQLATVIEARVQELFNIVCNELEHAQITPEMLSAGIVITGGTSLLHGICQLAQKTFDELPVRVGIPKRMVGMNDQIRDPRYASAVGLLLSAQKYAQQNGISAGRENVPKTQTYHETVLTKDTSPDNPQQIILPRQKPEGIIKRYVKKFFNFTEEHL